MTQEEFNRLPMCLHFRNPDWDCPNVAHSWDSCLSCEEYKYNRKHLMGLSVEEALSGQE